MMKIEMLNENVAVRCSGRQIGKNIDVLRALQEAGSLSIGLEEEENDVTAGAMEQPEYTMWDVYDES